MPPPARIDSCCPGDILTLLRKTADQIVGIANPDSLVEQLLEAMLHKSGYRAGKAEQMSWRRSLPAFAETLTDAGLGSVDMLIEYQMPLTSQRADVVLAGRHPKTGAPSFVVVELKQWSSAYAHEGSAELVDVPGMPGGPKLNPILQVRNYCQYLGDFASALSDQPDALAGLAYLHNATEPAAVADLNRVPVTIEGQLFTAADSTGLRAFLQSRLASDGLGSADVLLSSAFAPSQQLLKVAAAEIKDREQFHLLGDQQLAVEQVKHDVQQARAANTKRVVIVTGGPGSGKSVIALSLLGELAREGRSVIHATGSRSFTQTLRRVAGHRSTRVKSMFKYFNSFMTAGPNDLDVAIYDEAHRIRETSVSRWTKAEHRTGRPQLDELIAAARVPVFLLDQHQVVRPGEMGTREQIETHAAGLGLEVHHVNLGEQFRCGGSEAYIDWVVRLLGLAEGGPVEWKEDPTFVLQVADTPEEMEYVLQSKLDDGYSARMSAGYCWPWSNKRDDNTLVDDVEIGGWARPWNSKEDKRLGDAPPSQLWATEEGGFGQVGCVYTAQGFEYDWSGVILGPDLVWRDGQFVSRREFNKDPDFKAGKKVSDLRFDHLVRNVYKVLLTRGMIGTVIYSTDPETREALRELTTQ